MRQDRQNPVVLAQDAEGMPRYPDLAAREETKCQRQARQRNDEHLIMLEKTTSTSNFGLGLEGEGFAKRDFCTQR